MDDPTEELLGCVDMGKDYLVLVVSPGVGLQEKNAVAFTDAGGRTIH